MWRVETGRDEVMIKLFPCPDCHSSKGVIIVEYAESVRMKGVRITYPAEIYRCISCRAEYYSPEMLDNNLQSARDVYKHAREMENTE